jgi:hypothetical protein
MSGSDSRVYGRASWELGFKYRNNYQQIWVRLFWSVTLVTMKMNWRLRPVWPISGFIFNFLSPLHVSAPSGHPQKERGRLLIYQHHPVMTGPIPHVLLLYMWEPRPLTPLWASYRDSFIFFTLHPKPPLTVLRIWVRNAHWLVEIFL